MEEESMCEQQNLNRRLPPFLIGVIISIRLILFFPYWDDHFDDARLYKDDDSDDAS